MTADSPATLNGEFLPARARPLKRRYNLATLGGLRQEMCAIYRQSRNGRIPMADGSRLVFMLSQIGRILELSEIESRISKLEDAQHGNL